jgi:hypothetical protein
VGKHSETDLWVTGRGAKLGVVAAMVLGLCVAGASAGGTSVRGEDGAPRGAKAPVQPLVTDPAPKSRHSLPFGTLRVSPTALVAGAPNQDLDVTVDPDGSGGPDEVLVRIYRPADPSSISAGRATPRVELASRMLALAVGTRSITLSNLNPPPGEYRVDVLRPSGSGGSELIERAAVAVYSQHRLPPGAAPSGGSVDPKHDLDGTDPAPETKALPSPSVNNNISVQAGQQAETYAAAEFDNPARVIAAVNPASGNPQAWISNDSMRPGTDTENTLPTNSLQATAEGGATLTPDLCCDPALAADDRGNLWYAVLATAPNYIVINRAAGPSGTSFQPQNVAIPRFSTGLQDKEMIAIDTWPTSPKRYRLYAVWIENPGQHVVVSECDATIAADCDNPNNWTDPPQVVSDGSSATRSYPSVAAAPNGDVYVAWWDQTNDDITIERCLAAENCEDFAQWNEETDVDDDLDPGSATSLPFFCPIISAPGGRVGPQSYVDVGPDGRVYVAYSELRSNGSSRCTASANDRTFESRIAAGAANTFPTLNSGVRVSDDTSTALNDHFFPTLAADPSVPSQVETSVYSTKLDPSGQTTQQFYVVSTNGGASYGAMQQITTELSNFSGANSDGFDYGDYAGADAVSGMFYPSWTDNRASHGGDAELYMLTPEAITPPPGGDGSDTDPPETTITSGPPNKVKTKKKQAGATFAFTSSEAGSSFQCAVDGQALKVPCTSPFKVKVKAKKKTRTHEFDVRATDAAGNADPTPAEDDWKVKRKKKK